jgi:hypothetical protein
MSLWILSHFRCWTSQTGRSHGELLFSWDGKNILYMILRTIAFLLNFLKPTKQKFRTWFFQVVSLNIIVKYGRSSLFRASTGVSSSIENFGDYDFSAALVQCLALVKAQVFDWKSMNVFINFILFELSWLFHYKLCLLLSSTFVFSFIFCLLLFVWKRNFANNLYYY